MSAPGKQTIYIRQTKHFGAFKLKDINCTRTHNMSYLTGCIKETVRVEFRSDKA